MLQVDSSKFLCHLVLSDVKFVAARIFSSQISIHNMRYCGSSLEIGAMRDEREGSEKENSFLFPRVCHALGLLTSAALATLKDALTRNALVMIRVLMMRKISVTSLW